MKPRPYALPKNTFPSSAQKLRDACGTRTNKRTAASAPTAAAWPTSTRVSCLRSSCPNTRTECPIARLLCQRFTTGALVADQSRCPLTMIAVLPMRAKAAAAYMTRSPMPILA